MIPTKRIIADVLAQLSDMKEEGILKVGNDSLEVSHLNKPLWKKSKQQRAYTKRELLMYYAKVSPYLLPHLKDRPTTLVRFPHGVGDLFFFQKHPQTELPKFVKTFTIWTNDKNDNLPYITIDNLASLLYFVQLATIDFHPWYSRATNTTPDPVKISTRYIGSDANVDKSVLNYPDFIVFDLDPYIYSGKEKAHEEPERNKKSYEATREVAFQLKEVLDTLALPSFPKTSGKTGIHIYVPIKRNMDYDDARAAAKSIGEYLRAKNPGKITMEWSVAKRKGKIFFDHNQNVRGKTLASVLSVRAYQGATVSMPLTWKQLETASPLDFTLENVPDLLAKYGDPWAKMMKAKKDFRKIKL